MSIPSTNLPIFLQRFSVSFVPPASGSVSWATIAANPSNRTNYRVWSFALFATLSATSSNQYIIEYNLDRVESEGFLISFEGEPEGYITIKNTLFATGRKNLTFTYIDTPDKKRIVLTLDLNGLCTIKPNKTSSLLLNFFLNDASSTSPTVTFQNILYNTLESTTYSAPLNCGQNTYTYTAKQSASSPQQLTLGGVLPILESCNGDNVITQFNFDNSYFNSTTDFQLIYPSSQQPQVFPQLQLISSSSYTNSFSNVFVSSFQNLNFKASSSSGTNIWIALDYGIQNGSLSVSSPSTVSEDSYGSEITFQSIYSSSSFSIGLFAVQGTAFGSLQSLVISNPPIIGTQQLFFGFPSIPSVTQLTLTTFGQTPSSATFPSIALPNTFFSCFYTTSWFQGLYIPAYNQSQTYGTSFNYTYDSATNFGTLVLNQTLSAITFGSLDSFSLVIHNLTTSTVTCTISPPSQSAFSITVQSNSYVFIFYTSNSTNPNIKSDTWTQGIAITSYYESTVTIPSVLTYVPANLGSQSSYDEILFAYGILSLFTKFSNTSFTVQFIDLISSPTLYNLFVLNASSTQIDFNPIQFLGIGYSISIPSQTFVSFGYFYSSSSYTTENYGIFLPAFASYSVSELGLSFTYDAIAFGYVVTDPSNMSWGQFEVVTEPDVPTITGLFQIILLSPPDSSLYNLDSWYYRYNCSLQGITLSNLELSIWLYDDNIWSQYSQTFPSITSSQQSFFFINRTNKGINFSPVQFVYVENLESSTSANLLVVPDSTSEGTSLFYSYSESLLTCALTLPSTTFSFLIIAFGSLPNQTQSIFLNISSSSSPTIITYGIQINNASGQNWYVFSSDTQIPFSLTLSQGQWANT